jgi:maltose alpha-D-glucosyltransferase/alpha-amylase
MAIEIRDTPHVVTALRPGASVADDPLWYKDAVIYEVHVKSFFDSNNDGIGDFQGLTQKLDYLQGLGVTCLWLLPFFPSPLKDDGYDIADYLNVHPSYGTLGDFKAFVRAAHERRMKVLIELVVNHTSDQHPWFQRARRSPAGSPEREFYVWSDTGTEFPDTRVIFCDTEKSNWEWDPVANQYYWHRFFSHQPDLNHNNPVVVDSVIDVMKFWLELGVDAFRLDAVPYLCVREGTNNESLPETHDVLRRMRREMDAGYKNRMLLAEANQWPADVRPYFGAGDECHMAFHFPLMPRMFMALRQEDRHAITEILRQTPEIPENCQWALFLRNHDELTLEMVTDEERDYMYQAYAADPQMRLNHGIRRRLAPLVENSRRRIELLNSLLFSLPGTPIVYYGDEIGMGDNIYLGDRNGVRTPMQWSSDRNGGFSRADPARLFAPPIMDPVYGYQAINVEAQERYPFSLLNWMKRLIAMRKQHRVFGRGAVDVINGSNRKILSFLRRDSQETILVVANLSRSVQPVELDLSALGGLIPMEMWGLTEFPRIAASPYVLTLGPYAAYWFTLQEAPVPVTQIPPRAALDLNAALGESLPSLLVGPAWEGVFNATTRDVLECQALAPYLRRQPWFGSTSKEIRHACFADWTMVRGGSTPAFLAVATVSYVDGSSESYLLPLAFVAGDQARRTLKESPAHVVARVTGARNGAVIDGLLDADTCDRLLEIVAHGRQVPTGRGEISGLLVADRIDLPPQRKWVRGSGDQSNSLAFVNDRYVLKLYRRIEPGPNPEFEIALMLARQGFARTPALAGGVRYKRPGSETGMLALVQSWVPNQGSGWDATIDELGRYYERVAARIGGSAHPPPSDSPEAPSSFFAALENVYLAGAATLGRRTAELHLALARGTEPAFAPEPFGAPELAATSDAMKAHATEVLDLLASRLGILPDRVRPKAEAVLAAGGLLFDRFDAIRAVDGAGWRSRIHGDYHLGQVLRTEEDFAIVDFEGDPARSIEERRAKQSPLKDVAGMMRSFSYAAHAALAAFTVHAPDDSGVLQIWADTWYRFVAEAFLRGYGATLEGSPLIPRGPHFDTLLRAYALERGLSELRYELTNRPDWVPIPLMGLLKLT